MAPIDQFIQAIAQQETGGEANPYTSRWGKYAINPAYVNSMAMQYLGRPMSAAQYMSSPANQDLLGRAALTALYNKYGAQGAASSWYSGSPNGVNNTKPQPGGPSIADYVKSVMGRMGSFTDNIDVSKQPADSPISPWQSTLTTPASTTATPTSAASGMGLNAATGPLDAGTGGLGLEAADGTTPTPSTTQASAAPENSTAGGSTGVTTSAPAGTFDSGNGAMAEDPNPRSVNQAIAYASQAAASGSSGWYNRCLAFVAQAYGLGGSGTNYAIDAFKRLPSTQQHYDRNPTIGSLVFWDTGAGRPGHVALYMGNGMIASTDIGGKGKISIVPIGDVEQKWGSRYVGWSNPYFAANGH